MGNIDLFHSRRTNYHKCEYWVRDERSISGTPEQWVYNHKSNGCFWAKIISNKTNQINIVNNVWALDSNHIALESDDYIQDICRGSLVSFNDELWLVENANFIPHNKESEFSKHIDYKTVIYITRQ